MVLNKIWKPLKITEYVDGFQYENTYTGFNTTPVLKFVPTAEGYYNFENNKYIYSYTDHLGNVRLSYSKNLNGSAEVLEENNYYAFGLKHNAGIAPTANAAYNYQYNGKELQKETGWSDYGARMYMSDIGRWGVIDPLAEQMRRHSPYNYAFNNPVSFTDPDGRKPMIYNADGVMRWEFDPLTTINGTAWFEGPALRYGGFGGSSFLSQGFTGGGGDGSDDFSTIPGGNTYYGQEAYNELQKLLVGKSDFGAQFSFSQFDFSKFGLDDPTPKRKYLKNKSTFSRWGIETIEQQYQLDHSNTILELKQIISATEELTDRVDDITDWTPAITGIKGFYDFIKEGAKSLNPGTLIVTLGATTISIENSNAKNFLEMYRNVQSNYLDMHSKNPDNMKGVTVNINMIKGPQNHIWSSYSFYDIYTHRYLGGRTFE